MAKSKAVLRGHPVHLPDGSWGIRIEGDAEVRGGDQVEVTSKGGKTWTAIVGEVVDRNQWGVTCTRRDDRQQTQAARAATPAPAQAKPTGEGDAPFVDDDPGSVPF